MSKFRKEVRHRQSKVKQFHETRKDIERDEDDIMRKVIRKDMRDEEEEVRNT